MAKFYRDWCDYNVTHVGRNSKIPLLIVLLQVMPCSQPRRQNKNIGMDLFYRGKQR